MTNNIRDGWGPKFSWHLSYSWGKTPEKSQAGKLTRPRIEPGAHYVRGNDVKIKFKKTKSIMIPFYPSATAVVHSFCKQREYTSNALTTSNITEWGGSVVTHETRIREVPVPINLTGFFFLGFPQSPRQMLGWIFIWQLFNKFIYHKIKICELNKWNIDYTNELTN